MSRKAPVFAVFCLITAALSLVYLIVWAVSYYLNKKKVDEINRQLQGKA